MFKLVFAALSLLVAVDASADADEYFYNGMASCESFASNFENTCTEAGPLSSMPSASVTCQNYTNYGTYMSNKCAGTVSGTDDENCTWERKLCVTCRNDGGSIKIRVQTNGLPSHCYRSPNTAPVAQTVDFEVKWLSTAPQNGASNPSNQKGLNSLLCDSLTIAADTKIPNSAGY